MRILLTGGTGFIGNKLGQRLVENGHEVVTLTRSVEKAKAKISYPCRLIKWDSENSTIPLREIEDIEAVFNMAGAGIADKKWSEKRKKELRDSRIQATEKLVESFKNARALKIFVSFSAVGYFGDRGDEVLTEESVEGVGFLPRLCKDWEEAGEKIKRSHSEVRFIVPRLGVVLGESEGFLARLEPVFRSNLGGRLGSGKQFLSWIHIEDLLTFLLCCLEEPLEGVYHLVAPGEVRNKTLTKDLAKALQVMTSLPVPSMMIKALYGEMSHALLDSQRVKSQRWPKSRFKFPDSQSALSDIYRGLQKNEARHQVEQWIPVKSSELWKFFSSEKNLEEITPGSLKFKVERMSTPEIEEGTVIEYRLKLHGVPAKWKTLISHWDPPRQFVDEQLSGPYEKWHHVHDLIEFGGGTLLRDKVTFQLPFGSFGRIGGFVFVKNNVDQIFKYRAQQVAKRFHS